MAAVVERQQVLGIVAHFEDLPDARSTVNRRHLLVDVITISVCGVLAGADGPWRSRSGPMSTRTRCRNS